MNGRLQLCALRVFAAICLLSTMPTQAMYGSELEPAMRKQDDRLDRPITLKASHIMLGQLLNSLAEKTGVELRLDMNIPSSGRDVTVWLQNAPLYDVLNGLWSLYSYKQATWEWQREGESGHYRYKFVETSAARALAQKLRDYEQQAFGEQAKTFVALAHMTPEQRKDHVKELADCLLQDDTNIAQILLKNDSNDRTLWQGLRLFDEALSPEQKSKAILEHQAVRIPIDQLSAEGQALIHKFAQNNTVSENGVEQHPEPKWIEFLVEPKNARSPKSVRTLYIMPEGMGGQSYVGGGLIANGFMKRLFASWILPGDKVNSLIESQVIKAPAQEASKEIQAPTTPDEFAEAVRTGKVPTKEQVASLAESRFKQAADGVPFSFIARLPDRGLRDTGKPYAQTAGKFLHQYEGFSPDLMHKWRNNVLLISHPYWYYDEEANTPYASIQRIRTAYKKGGGFLSLRTIADLFRELTPRQLEYAAAEFPVLELAGSFPSIFILSTTYPDILDVTGAEIVGPLLTALSQFGPVAESPQFKQNDATAIRFIERRITKLGVPEWEARIELRSRNNSWKPVAGFPQKKHLLEN